MTTLKAFRRALSAAVAASVAAAAPGFPAYAAAASVVRLETPVSQGPRAAGAPYAGAAASALSISPLAAAPLGASLLPSAAPSALTSAAAPAAALPAAMPAAASAARASAPALSIHAAASASPVISAAATPSERAAAPVGAARAGVTAALEAAGDLGSAAPSSLRGLGEKLERALTGAPALSPAASLAAPSSDAFGGLTGRDGQLARPAGDLIRQTAEAHDGAAAPVPPAAPKQAPPSGPKTPFWPKVLAAGLALVPAYFLGLPLVAAGSVVLGGLTLGASASLAVMPFLGEGAPKLVKAVPGAALAALGVAAIFSGFAVPGAFAAAGGWGLIRYGLGKSNLPRYESVESLTAYFGGVAALGLVALAAAHPAGWLAAAAPYAGYPVAALLWLHLPSWVGTGMIAVFNGLYLGAKGLLRTATAAHRDTGLFARLSKFSERQWTASKWNAVWLSVMWTPIVLAEGAKWLAGAAAGLYAGAVSAPVMFLWGASFKLFGAGKAAAYFGEAARFAFDRVQNGKAAIFNKAESRLLPWTESAKLPSRAAGSAALTALQLAWLVYAVVGTPLLAAAGLLFAFARMGSYDAARHDPDSLKVNVKDSPGEIAPTPDQPEPSKPAKPQFAPKLIAAALALAPFVYFGLPLLAGTLYHVVGVLYSVLALTLAAMPFMGPRTPRFLKSLAARGMQWNGLLLLVSGHAILAGALAALGGWGFSRYVAERDGQNGSFDDASELGAFFGALGASVAVGAAWTGLTGTWGLAALGLAAVTSPFLLMHLPEWMGRGVVGAFAGIPDSVRDYAAVLGFWHDGTRFMANLRRHADFWLGKTYWNGVWLSLIWVPTGLLAAAEYIVSAGLGLAAGVVRAPLGFLAAAFKRASPEGKAAVFLGAALDGWRAAAEGSKPLFDRMTAGLKPAMDESSPVSGRPTLKAMAAFLGARVLQLAWLLGVLAMSVSGAALAVGLYRGARAALAPAPKKD